LNPDLPFSAGDARRSAWRSAVFAAAAVLAALGAAPARASLGDSLPSVEADRLQLRATAVHANRAAYTVHELTLENKGIVREYVSPAGTVFAVTWHVPLMPNLKQLLGQHFEALSQSQDRERRGMRHMELRTDEVVLVNHGRVRDFNGAAYLIHGLPSGVSVDDIK
jgi:hypothetical protein